MLSATLRHVLPARWARGVATATLAVLVLPWAVAADWPQWRGSARDGRLAQFATPSPWPRQLTVGWKKTVGEGHASPVVAGNRVYVFSREGEEEMVQALDLATGARAWRQSYAAPYQLNPAAHAHGKGPKATPAVERGRVFTFGISGVLSCFEAGGGRLLWRKDTARQHDGSSPIYGVASSPLVDGERLIVHTGGAGDGALSAFDAASGKLLWAWKADGPGYASPVVGDIAGVRQVVTFSESHLVGIAADSGQLLWRLPFTTSYDQNAVTPIVHGDTVIYSGLDNPLRAMKPVRRGSGWTIQPLWENADVAAYMSTPVLASGRLYGLSHRRRGQLFCLDATSGKTIWLSEGRQGENAALVAAGEIVFALTTAADLIVFTQGRPSFSPLQSYRVAETPTWAHPVLLDTGLLVKDRESLALLRF